MKCKNDMTNINDHNPKVNKIIHVYEKVISSKDVINQDVLLTRKENNLACKFHLLIH